METATMVGDVLWVCSSCMFVAEGVSDADSRSAWRLVSAARVTPGLRVEDHDDECPNVEGGRWVGGEDCWCEDRDFSWSPCDACGSSLGGSRHAYTVQHDCGEA